MSHSQKDLNGFATDDEVPVVELSDDDMVLRDSQGTPTAVVDKVNYSSPGRKLSRKRSKKHKEQPSTGNAFLQPPPHFSPGMAAANTVPVAGSPYQAVPELTTQSSPMTSHGGSPVGTVPGPATPKSVPPLFQFMGAVAGKAKEFFGGQPSPNVNTEHRHTPVIPGAIPVPSPAMKQSPYMQPQPEAQKIPQMPLPQYQNPSPHIPTLPPQYMAQPLPFQQQTVPGLATQYPYPGQQPPITTSYPFQNPMPYPGQYTAPPPYLQTPSLPMNGFMNQQPGGAIDPYYFEKPHRKKKSKKSSSKSKSKKSKSSTNYARPAGADLSDSDSDDEEIFDSGNSSDFISNMAPILVLLVAGVTFLLTNNRPPAQDLGLVSQTVNRAFSSLQTGAIIGIALSALVLLYKFSGFRSAPTPSKSSHIPIAGSSFSEQPLRGTELNYMDFFPEVTNNNFGAPPAQPAWPGYGQPGGQFAGLPNGLPTGLPSGLPAGLSGLPPGLSGFPTTQLGGNPGFPGGLPPGLTSSLPAQPTGGFPGGLPAGLTSSLPGGIPGSASGGIPGLSGGILPGSILNGGTPGLGMLPNQFFPFGQMEDSEDEELDYLPAGSFQVRPEPSSIPPEPNAFKKEEKTVSPLIAPFKLDGISKEMMEEEGKSTYYEPMPPLPGMDDPTIEPVLYETLKKGPNKELLAETEKKKNTKGKREGKAQGKADERISGTTKKKDEYFVDDWSCKPYGPPPKRYRGVNV